MIRTHRQTLLSPRNLGLLLCTFIAACLTSAAPVADDDDAPDVSSTKAPLLAWTCETDADCAEHPEAPRCGLYFPAPILVCGCGSNDDCPSGKVCRNVNLEPQCVECSTDEDCMDKGPRAGCRDHVCVPEALQPEYAACTDSGGRGNCDFGLYCTQVGPASGPHCFREGPCFDEAESFMGLICTTRCGSRADCPSAAPECYKAPDAPGWCVPH